VAYEFTVDWFTHYWPSWVDLIGDREIRFALEIGSFEGLSACTMIEHFGAKSDFHLFCIDTWAGSVEHGKFDAIATECRFDSNTNKATSATPFRTTVTKLKGFSNDHLFSLISQGRRATFDLVYVDGSHRACDVLLDIILAYELTHIGGLIFCDDYLWTMENHGAEDLLNCPRLAIDAFKNIFARKIVQMSGPAYQCYFEKTG